MSEKTMVLCDGCLEVSNYDEVDIFKKGKDYIIFRCPFCGLIDEDNGIFVVETGNEDEEAFLTEIYEHPEKILCI
jgi:hypothetical protein